ncbi:hypothetical protein [Streptomyces sp. NPDC088360]|uniref:hypothetical protein n=1 Tax=Streptomyces sp. NPDC088360 TaxID=3154515 RepID=UPI00344E46C0
MTEAVVTTVGATAARATAAREIRVACEAPFVSAPHAAYASTPHPASASASASQLNETSKAIKESAE